MPEAQPVQVHGPYRPPFLFQHGPVAQAPAANKEEEPPAYTRAHILAEAAGRGVDPEVCRLGNRLRIEHIHR